METIKELLDDVKAKAGVESNNGIAGILGVRRQRVTDYYNGVRVPDNIVCKRIAEYLGRPLPQIIATVGADSEKDESRRAEWRDYFKSIGGYAASFVIAFLLSVTLIVTTTKNAQANQYVKNSILQEYKLCVYWSQIRIRVLAAWHALSIYFPRFCFSY